MHVQAYNYMGYLGTIFRVLQCLMPFLISNQNSQCTKGLNAAAELLRFWSPMHDWPRYQQDSLCQTIPASAVGLHWGWIQHWSGHTMETLHLCNRRQAFQIFIIYILIKTFPK